MISTLVGLLLMDIDTKLPLLHIPGIRVEEFVKVGEQISLCTEFKPWNQEGKLDSIFVPFQMRCFPSDSILVNVTT